MIGTLATKTSKQEDTFEQFKTEIKAHNEAEEQTMYRVEERKEV